MIYLMYGGNTGGWRCAFHRQLGAAGLSITVITAWKLNLSSFSKIPRLTSRVDRQYNWKNFRPSAAAWWISSMLHVDTKLMVYAVPSLEQAEIRKMKEWWKCMKCQNPYCHKTIPMSIRFYFPACGTSDLGLTASAPLLSWWEFSFYLGLRARNRSLVEIFLCINFVLSPDQIKISRMNRWLSCRLMWYILTWSHH